MGDNLAKRLYDIGGVEGRQQRIPLRSIVFHRTGPIAHPRINLFDAVNNPKDRALVDSIKIHGFKRDYPLGGRENGRGNPLDGAVGSRRWNAAIIAERELLDEGKLTETDKQGNLALMVPVEVRACTDLEIWQWREEENADPLAVPDPPSVLSVTFRQMVALGATHEELARRHGNGFTADIVEALCRMPNLDPSLVSRFDSEEVPIAALGAVLDAPRDEQGALLDSIMVPLDHLPKEERTKRKIKAAIKEATRDEPVKETTKMLPRRKLDRVWEAVEERLNDPDDNKARGEKWEAFVKGIRFVIGGDPDALEGLPDYLIVTVKAAMAARKPGRKSNKAEE